MVRIVFILPYFGRFNNYFQLWLNSCAANPSVDWLIYTDSNQEFVWPKNCKKITCSFEEFKERIQSIFDFKISLNTPYKLCDYKVVYGEALKDDIEGYDFWGYCDCDLIFGDILGFQDLRNALDRHDKLFTRGHFSLYRVDTTKEIYKQFSDDYKKVYSCSESFAFDEWAGISRLWDESGQDYYDGLLYDDIITYFSGLHPTKKLSGYGSPYHRKNQDESKEYRRMKKIVYLYKESEGLKRYWYDSKEKRIKNEAVLYVHLQKRKMAVSIDTNSKEFIIVPNEFVPKQTIDNDFLTKANSNFSISDCISMGKLLVHNLIGR